jgi:ABC-type nitrate/sulfonate/bicarbonate transport system permease component
MSRRVAYNLAGVAIALLLWEAIGRLMGEALFAPLSVVLVEYVKMLRDGQMLGELVGSLRQMLVGYVMACVVGLPIGVAMGRSRLLDALLHPWLSMLVVTSVASLVPLFVIVFGTGFWFRAVIVFLAAVWYVMLTIYHGARGIEPRLLDVGRSFGAPPLTRFHKIILPALYPYVVTALRIGLVHAIRAMVVAEMFIILGYGGLIYRASYSLTTAPLLGLLLTLMIVGVAANAALQRGTRVLAPWYEDKMGRSAPPL